MSGGGGISPGAIVGGAAGFAMGGPAGAAIGAGLGGSLDASGRAANAAQNAANATAAETRNQRNAIVGQGQANQTAAMQLAQATPQELMALERSMGSSMAALERQEKLINSIDPAIMEASSQALKLLRGESAGITDATNQMRKMQRDKLVGQLREQYGPGAELSSLGQKALQSFDMQTQQLTAQNNQQALSQVFGIATSDFQAPLRASQNAVQQVGQGFGALQERKLNTQVNTGNSILAALSGTAPGMIQSAGAPYVGEAVRAQGQQSMFNTLGNIGALYASGGMPGSSGSAGSNGVAPGGNGAPKLFG